MKMETKIHQSLVRCFLHRLMSNVLCHYSCIPLAMVIWLGLWARCFACTVLCDYLFSVIVARYVIWSGSPMRGSGHESSCYLPVALQTFQLSWFDHETPVWEPTPSLPVLQLSGWAYLVVIPTLTFRPVGLTPDWGHVNANRLARATKLRFHFCFQFCFQFPFSIFISLQFRAFPYAPLNIIRSRVQITDTGKMTSEKHFAEFKMK